MTLLVLLVGGRATVVAQVTPPQCEPLPLGEAPASLRAALDSLAGLAEAGHSDALIILHDGKVVLERYYGGAPRPIQTMSATKSVVGLAVGQLLDQGHLDSLSQPVADFFPQWRQGRKRDVTVEMILSHTSGLQNVPNAGAEIYPAPNALQLALAAELEAEPGAEWSYNNKAVNLLAGVFERATGSQMDTWIYGALFEPLCIETREWYRDRSDTPHAMAGVELTPRELARLGQLVLQAGEWRGRQVVPTDWIRRMTRPSQPMEPRSGLLWWLLPAPGDSLGTHDGPGAVEAYYAEGFLGNYLVVIPSQKMVVVRMKEQAEDFERAHAIPGFPKQVLELLGTESG